MLMDRSLLARVATLILVGHVLALAWHPRLTFCSHFGCASVRSRKFVQSRSSMAVASTGTAHAHVNAPGRTVIVGGGPAGLATAISLARRGWTNIKVYDRLAEPADPDDEVTYSDTARFYLIGLGGRGQNALRAIGAWDDVNQYTNPVIGRRDWAPGAGADEGVERIFKDRPYKTEVIARDRLAGVLLRHAREHYGEAVEFNYGVECAGVSWLDDNAGKEVVRLDFERCTKAPEAEGCEVEKEPFTGTADLLVGADGAARSIAEAMEADDKQARQPWQRFNRLRVTRFKDDNVRVYKTVPMKIPADWRGDINYSARTKDGRLVLDALPADREGQYCGVLLLREDDPLAQPDSSAADLRAEFDRLLPQFSALIDDQVLASVARKPPSRLPRFRFVGPRLHRGGSTVLLGDAIHTVKPYFGLGANSAFEDVIGLNAAIDKAMEGDMKAALKGFTHARAGEAETLVRMSREFDRPGFIGFLTFVLPLILDSICSKLAPRVFGQNTIAMLQVPSMTFRGVMWRKRKDRVLQLLLIGGFMTLACYMMLRVVKLLVVGIHRAPQQMAQTAGVLCAGFAIAAIARWIRNMRHMAPADVLTKGEQRAVQA